MNASEKLSAEPQPSASANAALFARYVEWLDEVRTIRASVPSPAPEDGPRALDTHLTKARHALDRVEAILANLYRIRGQAREVLAGSRSLLKVAEDTHLARKRFSEYVSTRERMAWLASRTLEGQTAVWEAEVALERTNAVIDEVRLIYNGIDGLRRDVDTRLRIFVFERSLGG